MCDNTCWCDGRGMRIGMTPKKASCENLVVSLYGDLWVDFQHPGSVIPYSAPARIRGEGGRCGSPFGALFQAHLKVVKQAAINCLSGVVG